MSCRSSFFVRALAGLVLAGLLLAGGALLFQAGQAQGYQMGLVAADRAAGGETQAVTPPLPYGYWPAYARPPFGLFPFAPLGGLCGSILIVLLALFALRLIFWPRRWFYDGKGAGNWRNHPHPWGPPPWTREQQRPEAGSSEPPAADGQTSGASPA